jgi:hypothetical protein
MYISGEVIVLEVDGREIRVQSYIVRIAPDISTRSLSSLSVIQGAESGVGSTEADHTSSEKKGLQTDEHSFYGSEKSVWALSGDFASGALCA